MAPRFVVTGLEATYLLWLSDGTRAVQVPLRANQDSTQDVLPIGSSLQTGLGEGCISLRIPSPSPIQGDLNGDRVQSKECQRHFADL